MASTLDVAAAIRPAAGRRIAVVVDRDGRQLTLHPTPIATEMPRLDESGNVVTTATGAAETVTAGYLGMSNRAITQIQRQPITAAPGVIAEGVAGTAGVVLRLPDKLVGVWQAAFGTAQRDLNGPISVVGVGRVAGEVAEGRISWIQGPTETAAALVQLLAALNIALFVFNLIPLMPLDGGHVLGALWEGLKRAFARLARRPDPGYVDVAKGLPIAYAASILLIGMSALLIYADIVKPVRF